MEQNKPSSFIPDNVREYLASLGDDADFQKVLALSRQLAATGLFKDSNLCNSWLLERRPKFTPAVITMCSNYLRLEKFQLVIKLLDDLGDSLRPNEDQSVLLRYILAKALFETGEYLKAETVIFESLVEKEGKPLWYNILEIDILEKLGKTEELKKLLDNKIEFYKDNRVLVNKKFDILNKSGEFQNAFKHINDELQKDPDNSDLLFHKAVIHFNNQELPDAKLSFKRILELKKDYRAHLWMGRILSIEDDSELASYHLKEAIKSADTDGDKFYCLNILTEINHDILIDRLINKWLISGTIEPDVLHQIAQIRIKQLKYDDAQQLLEEALVLKEDMRYYYELAKVASAKKEYDKAESILIINDLMNHSNLGYFARNEYGLIAKRKGKFVEALQRFKDFSAFYPDEFKIKSQIVNLYLKLSRFNEATDYLLAEIESSPSNMQAWQVLIDCYFKNQNYFTALSKIQEYIQQFGEDEKVLAFKTQCLREVGRYEDTMSTLDRALDLFPDSFDLKISKAHLFRRLSSEYFFEKEAYNLKALEIHQSTKAAHAYQKRVLNVEIINDLIHLNRFSEALDQIEVFLKEREGHTEMYYTKVKVLSKMGSHQKAYDFIRELPESFREDPNLLVLEASELLSMDKWEDCSNVLEEIEALGQYPDALIIDIKLRLRNGNFDKAKCKFFQLIELSPHHAFIHNEVMDFGLSCPEVYHKLAKILGVVLKLGDRALIELYPHETMLENKRLILDLGKNVTVSHIFIDQKTVSLNDIHVSLNKKKYTPLSDQDFDLKYEGEGILIRGTFSFQCISILTDMNSSIKLFTVFPISPIGTILHSNTTPKKNILFTCNIVETGLGDQLHYIRTAALIGESLGMNLAGFLRSELEIVRDRVTEDPRLYSDLGFSEFLIEDDQYFIIKVPLKLTTRFVPAFYQWHSYTYFLEYINGLIDEAIAESEIPQDATPLIFLSVDDHNFTRLFARLFYPFNEPRSAFIENLSNSFIQKRRKRLLQDHDEKPVVLLQCRLGDVANIPIHYEGEDVWIIPFSGEVMKDSESSKYHMRYSNLEKIKEIGVALKDKFGSDINLKLITDGYDYGIDYLKNYKSQLMEEMGMENNDLDELKIVLADEFKNEFSFVHEIVYGEEYDKLIRSIDLVTQSNVLISTNGQFTNEFKMSFSADVDEYLMVKKLYSNLRVARSSNTKEMFWEIDGVDQSEMTDTIIEYIQKKIV